MVTGREALALLIRDKEMVQVAGLREPEEGLKQAMHVGGWEEIFPARDQADPLGRVIDHHGEVVGGRDVLPGQHHVPEEGGVDRDLPEPRVAKGERTGDGGCLSGVEPPAVGISGRDPVPPLEVREGATGARVESTLRAVGGVGHASYFIRNLPTSTEAGVDDRQILQGLKCGSVVREAGRLPPGGRVPRDSEPRQIFLELVVVLGSYAGVINVLESEQEGAAGRAREFMGDQRGVGVSKVEVAGGAGRKARGHGGVLTAGRRARQPKRRARDGLKPAAGGP